MSDKIYKQQEEIANIIERYSDQDGVHSTDIPSLFFARQSSMTGPIYGVYKPSLCIIVQGEKEVLFGREHFRYGPADYLVASIDLPVKAHVIEASSDKPYLSLKLEFTPNQVLEIVNDFHMHVDWKEEAKPALSVNQIDLSILDAVARLVRLLDNPKDIPALAPLFTKEILYKVLQKPHGAALAQSVMEGSSVSEIRSVIKYIRNHYDKPFRIEELAKIANMSVSSLHRYFKEVTAVSPIQFQKQLRLQEARRLLISESSEVAEVAFRVGYESPSQFNREYSRMFGFPPREDIKQLKSKYEEKINA